MTFIVKDTSRETERECSSRAEAEETKNDMISLGAKPENIEIVAPEKASDGGTEEIEAEIVEHTEESETQPVQEAELEQETEDALNKLGDSIEYDPLDVLPGYMITTVEGKPTLNKRGVSVLAYHYDISVIEHDVVAYPHETEYESAMVKIIVEGSDGRTFVGSGEANVDETSKHQLLRMAETRAYKRAVIFATGTGIVGYQELVGELE